jgi:hypothetical protein
MAGFAAARGPRETAFDVTVLELLAAVSETPSQSSRKATDTGNRAARMAGMKPPDQTHHQGVEDPPRAWAMRLVGTAAAGTAVPGESRRLPARSSVLPTVRTLPACLRGGE